MLKTAAFHEALPIKKKWENFLTDMSVICSKNDCIEGLSVQVEVARNFSGDYDQVKREDGVVLPLGTTWFRIYE